MDRKVANHVLEIIWQVGIAFIPFILGGWLANLTRTAFGITIANIRQLINAGALVSNPQFYITRILNLAFPFINKIKGISPLLNKALIGIDKAGNLLNKASRLFVDDLYARSKNAFFQGSGEDAPVVQDALKQIIAENNISQATGENVADLKFIQKPNTKNPNSWIMEVVFNEQLRVGTKCFGQMIVHYCSNNSARTGLKYVLKKGVSVQFGRTSAGKIKSSDLSSKQVNYVVKEVPKSDNWHVVEAVFEGCSLHGDFLPFLRAHSWGGYYMRRWMVSHPNTDSSNVVSPFLIFAPLRRFQSRVKSFVKAAQSLGKDPTAYISNQAFKFGINKLGGVKLGGVGLKIATSRGWFKNPTGNLRKLAVNQIVKNIKKRKK